MKVTRMASVDARLARVLGEGNAMEEDIVVNIIKPIHNNHKFFLLLRASEPKSKNIYQFNQKERKNVCFYDDVGWSGDALQRPRNILSLI